MKKIIVLLSVFLFVIPSFSFASIGVKQKQEVDCPPDYVGQSKCFIYYEPPTKKIIKEGEVTKPIVTSSGKKLPKHPYIWLTGSALGFITSNSSTAEQLVNNYWSTVNTADLWAGDFVSGVSDSSLDFINKSYAGMLLAGEDFLNLDLGVHDEVYKSLYGSYPDDIRNEINNYWASSYGGSVGSAVDYILSSSPQPQTTEILRSSIIKSGKYQGMALISWFYYNNNKYGTTLTNIYNITSLPVTNSYSSVGQIFKSYDLNDIKTKASNQHEEYLSGLSYSDEDSVKKYTDLSRGSVSGSVVSVPLSNYTPPSSPQIVEIDGYKYYEVESDYEGVPEFLPIDNAPPVNNTPVLVEGLTGLPLNPDGNVKNPVPVVNPDPTATQNGSPVVPPGDVETPTDPDTPTRNPEEDANDFASLFTNKFPFSLPWDIYNMIAAVTVEPERPELNFNETYNNSLTGQEINVSFSHDFAWMDSWIGFFRAFILIGFSIFLILGTRRLLGGAQ